MALVLGGGCYGDPQIELRVHRESTFHSLKLRTCDALTTRCLPDELVADVFAPGDGLDQVVSIYVEDDSPAVVLHLKATLPIGDDFNVCVPVTLTAGTVQRSISLPGQPWICEADTECELPIATSARCETDP